MWQHHQIISEWISTERSLPDVSMVKGTCYQICGLSLIPSTELLKGEKQLLQAISHDTCVCTCLLHISACPCIHTSLNRYKMILYICLVKKELINKSYWTFLLGKWVLFLAVIESGHCFLLFCSFILYLWWGFTMYFWLDWNILYTSRMYFWMCSTTHNLKARLWMLSSGDKDCINCLIYSETSAFLDLNYPSLFSALDCTWPF
jgi:hypothetical protein